MDKMNNSGRTTHINETKTKKVSNHLKDSRLIEPSSTASISNKSTADSNDHSTTTNQSLHHTSLHSKNHRLVTRDVSSISDEVTSASLQEHRPSAPVRMEIAQNFFLIWLDSSFAETNEDCKRFLTKLQQIVNTIKTYTDPNDCVNFVTDAKDENIFMITSGTLGLDCVPRIHHMPQIDSIYIFCDNKTKHEQWTKDWKKVKGVFTDIPSLCEALQQYVRLSDRDLMPITVTNARNPNELEPTFMYTTLFKEAILEMKYDKDEIHKLADACRNLYPDNEIELKIIDEFEQNYTADTSIWWYTRECFTYHVLNRALRTFDTTIMISIGLFIQSLHHHIEQLYSKQKHLFPKTLYRGQGLSRTDFDQLQASVGGLLSFNSFLSTSANREISYEFASKALEKSDHVGVLFKMTIDPACPCTPFAVIGEEGYYKETEKEILFSMNSIFRIGQVQIIQQHTQIFEVELMLTQNDDHKLQDLTANIREEISGSTGWHRLSKLLLLSGDLEQTKTLYHFLLNKAPRNDFAQIFVLNHELGRVYSDMGENLKALDYYKESLRICRRLHGSNDTSVGTNYIDIGRVYSEMGKYSKALEYYEKGQKIYEKSLSRNHSWLTINYNNIGRIYLHMGDESKALQYYQKGLDIIEGSLSPNHPELGTSYNYIGQVHLSMGNYPKALECYERGNKIYEKSLPPNHFWLVTSYSNLGDVYTNMAEYSKALEYYEKSHKIAEESLSPNHSWLATSYDSIGTIYSYKGEYSKALEYYEKAHKIKEQSLPPTHPDLGASYTNIGGVYFDVGEYSQALEYYQKARNISEKSLPPTHSSLAVDYNNIGAVYLDTGEYSKALEYYKKADKIKQKSLSSTHPSWANSYRSLGKVYRCMKDYTKALQYFKKALEIIRNVLSERHPQLGITYSNIGDVYRLTGDTKSALPFLEKAREILENVTYDPVFLAWTYNYMGELYRVMKDYSTALEFHGKAQKIREESLPSTHPVLAETQHNLAKIYKEMKQYKIAYEHAHQAVQIAEKRLSEKHPYMLEYRKTLSDTQAEFQS
ncbi:hypothetical protein I4U23_005133 [Adineta vaga]|nr:hypothetical protein I4U23_005133 [Adineta vaga]